MKKTALVILATMLLMALVSGSAFALTGDITIKAAKAYADPDMSVYIGTIPKHTSVLVKAYGTYAHLVVNGVECYVKPSTLTQGDWDYSYLGTATLKKGAKVYQRSSTSSRCVTTSKARKVKVYSVSDGYALVRSAKGVFGYVAASNLSDLKPY